MWLDQAEDTLAIIEAHESQGHNVMNFINDAHHTASGYWQITNETWRNTAPYAGVNIRRYPTAISAPKPVQHVVALTLLYRNGVTPWAAFSSGLAAQLGYTGPIYDENGLPTFYGRVSVHQERRRAADDQVWE